MIENDSELFKVDVENYNGPLDVLLDLAKAQKVNLEDISCLLYTSPSPRDVEESRMPSSA
mgnify:CR=1 FL=1